MCNSNMDVAGPGWPAIARQRAGRGMSQHHTQYGDLPLYIGGEACPSASDEWIEVTNPADQSLLARCLPKATRPRSSMRYVPPTTPICCGGRCRPRAARVMFNYQHLLKVHHDELATLLAQETGKNLADAKGDVWRASRWWSRPAPLRARLWGDHGQRGAPGRRPLLGAALRVCVGITPFNFPAMIPLWMFLLAVACGNGFVLKPSEQDPSPPCAWPSCLPRRGPKGILSVVHGGAEQVDALLAHPDVKAVSFVGSAGSAATSIAAPRRNSSGPSVLSAPRITW